MCQPQGDVPLFLPDRGVTQETAADPGSHGRFHPTQKHFHASNCLREKAYVRPVICARLKNSPAIFADFILTSSRSSTGKQQAFKMENHGKSHVVVMKTSEHRPGFLNYFHSNTSVVAQ